MQRTMAGVKKRRTAVLNLTGTGGRGGREGACSQAKPMNMANLGLKGAYSYPTPEHSQ